MISVCMATYNGEKWIRQQLTSILEQLSSDDEVVIADDGSSDDTLKMINILQDKRIRLLDCNTRVGPSANFNRTLKAAQGDYIFLADQDDVWLEGKVEKVMVALKRAELVMHDAQIIDGKGALLSTSYFQTRNVRHGVLKNLLRNSYTGCFMAFRKTLLDKIVPIPKSAAHDLWIALLAEKEGTALFLHEPLVLWRRHEMTVTNFYNRNWLSLASMIWLRLYTGFALIIRQKKTS